jgi:hypothetical protein
MALFESLRSGIGQPGPAHNGSGPAEGGDGRGRPAIGPKNTDGRG